VREALARTERDYLSEAEPTTGSELLDALTFVLRRPAEVVGVLTMAGLTAAILFNALILQTGTHPAPFFPSRAQPKLTTTPARPSPAPLADIATVKSIQAALTLRGLYDGTPDGVAGPKTVAAIRSFQDSAGLVADGIPSEALLTAVLARPVVGSDGRADQIGALITASAPAAPTPSPPARRVVSVEKALAALGYGPLKVDGLMDGATEAAIQRFESDRGLPVTGRISVRLARELTAVSGIPVE
jgi:peptidoglycan hydrolase-like protein with peptidoglycan-binding domain